MNLVGKTFNHIGDPAMKTNLLISPIKATQERILENCQEFLSGVNAELKNFQIEITNDNLMSEPYRLVFIGSGGAAAAFRDLFHKTEGPYVLLSTQYNNSLPACMEILSYINDHGSKGQIVYGTYQEIARKLESLDRIFRAKEKLMNMTFGVLGTPNVLINSESDPEVLKESIGINTVEISMKEVMDAISEKSYPENKYTEMLMSVAPDKKEMEKSLYVYGGIKRLVDKYHFDGIALRCFDLLEPIKTSGCIALAILNAEGIYAACEGDTRSLLSMAVLGEISGEPCFMSNPSRLNTEKSTMLFAHCTLPINMPETYSLDTHFESGISIAVRGEFTSGDFTLFKCRENMRDYFVQKGEFVSCPHEELFCRTQLELKIDDWQTYLIKPLSNHQIICKGNWTEEVDEFFSWLK